MRFKFDLNVEESPITGILSCLAVLLSIFIIVIGVVSCLTGV